MRDDAGCHPTFSLLGRACETEKIRACFIRDNSTGEFRGGEFRGHNKLFASLVFPWTFRAGLFLPKLFPQQYLKLINEQLIPNRERRFVLCVPWVQYCNDWQQLSKIYCVPGIFLDIYIFFLVITSSGHYALNMNERRCP